MKLAKYVALIAFVFSSALVSAQHNPYLDKKKKNRPSAKIRNDNNRHLKKQKKEAKKQMRRSKRSIARNNKRRMRG
jgi:hypothetical protein